jgi:hypothetical protein
VHSSSRAKRGDLRKLGVLNPKIATVFKKKPRNDELLNRHREGAVATAAISGRGALVIASEARRSQEARRAAFT